MRIPVKVGVAPAHFHLAALDSGQRVVLNAQARFSIKLGRVWQVEALTVVGPDLMTILEVVDGTEVEQVNLIIVAAAGHTLEIADIDIHLLAAGTAGDGQVVRRMPVHLGVVRQTINPVTGIARGLAFLVQVQPAAFG
ncbi:hypothetical protein D3C80_1487070 [compost metagenome]